jgi:plastocyanin
VIWIGDPGFRESGDRRNRNFLPNAVQIQAGETLRILNAGFHQVAVYKVSDGTTREQVTADPNAYVDTDIPGPLSENDIGDTNNRIALGPSPRALDRAVVNRDRALGMDLTINEPGRYLVICAIRSHFLDQDPAANGGLFGFIDVEEQLEGQGAVDITGPVGYQADVTVRFGDPRFQGRGDSRNRTMLPSEVEVSAGDTIRFVGTGLHQVAVYTVATDVSRQDVTSDPDKYVDTSINGPFNDGNIGDTNNRVALGPNPRTVDRDVVNRNDTLRWDLTINEPGRYLVICAIRSHFLDRDPGANGGLFGFVTVR